LLSIVTINTLDSLAIFIQLLFQTSKNNWGQSKINCGLIIREFMARLVRVSPARYSTTYQRGNNRQVCFVHYEDMKAYLNWLKVFSKKPQVSVPAMVLMTNYVHLICTPQGCNKSNDAICPTYVCLIL